MSLAKSNLTAHKSEKVRSLWKKGFFWEARTRILAWYGALMTGFIGLSVPLFSELVFTNVNIRVRKEIAEEITSFEQYVAQQSKSSEKFTQAELAEVFEEYMYRQIPEDDTFLIAILDDQFYRSSPRGRPDLLQEEGKLMQRWAKLTTKDEGEQDANDPKLGKIIYLASPVIVDGRVQGVYVVAHTTAGEIQEAKEVISIVVRVLLAVLVLALILAWIASGKVLSPLRSLTATARSISDLNLNKRIPIQSSGELGDLTIALNKMLDRLQDSFTSQRDFINDAGHELRTPITIVRGHLELLGDDPQEQQETIELVLDELDRMSRLVDDLILLAKSERPDFLYLETIDIGMLTQELFSKATALADRNWKLDSQAQGNLVGDRQRLTQAIMNLTENATQYTAQTDTIAIGSALRDGCIRLWVRDTGTGIAQSDRDRIFERFARASNSRRRSEGSGLGLSIVKAIAEAHGGKVELISEFGIGSTFTLVLPLDSRH